MIFFRGFATDVLVLYTFKMYAITRDQVCMRSVIGKIHTALFQLFVVACFRIMVIFVVRKICFIWSWEAHLGPSMIELSLKIMPHGEIVRPKLEISLWLHETDISS